MNIIVAYDIEDDRRRTSVHKVLLNFGVWAQYSVFECDLDEQQLVRMRHKLAELIDEKADSIIIYRLCPGCHRRLERMGVCKRLLDKQDLIV